MSDIKPQQKKLKMNNFLEKNIFTQFYFYF